MKTPDHVVPIGTMLDPYYFYPNKTAKWVIAYFRGNEYKYVRVAHGKPWLRMETIAENYL